jgi:hypothetical protein
MSHLKIIAGLILCSGLSLQAGYLGSYKVDDGPFWSTSPDTFTALEAAAQIFGGAPTDYFVSTNPDTVDPNTITHTGWQSTFGVPNGFEFAEDYKLNTSYNCGSIGCATSAYVDDNATGATYTNFVWTSDTVATPEPSTLILTASLASLAALRRRRKA